MDWKAEATSVLIDGRSPQAGIVGSTAKSEFLLMDLADESVSVELRCDFRQAWLLK